MQAEAKYFHKISIHFYLNFQKRLAEIEEQDRKEAAALIANRNRMKNEKRQAQENFRSFNLLKNLIYNEL